jgi:hypothetical protein
MYREQPDTRRPNHAPHRLSRLLLYVIPLIWIPYVALRLYWQHLLRTVPGADHGEASGPIEYFLARLLVLALVASGALLVVLAVLAVRRTAPAE